MINAHTHTHTHTRTRSARMKAGDTRDWRLAGTKAQRDDSITLYDIVLRSEHHVGVTTYCSEVLLDIYDIINISYATWNKTMQLAYSNLNLTT